VHRDFKPENVLLGDNGKIKVADFGLAIGHHSASSDFEKPGALAGTPRYMAPEQLRGEEADGRSDQFAFCLALHEGLWGRQPFSAETFHERLWELERGVTTTPAGHRALFRVIRRGLEPDPAKRWPGMDALLAALQRIRNASTRRRRAAAITLALAGTFALSYALIAPAAEPARVCKSGLEGVWDDDLRGQVRQHAETMPASHAQASAERLIASLDHWAGAWSGEHAALCEQLAGPVDRVLERESSARATCLLRQSAQVRELVLGVEQGGEDTLAKSVSAAALLPSPTDCTGALAKLGIEPPPHAIVPLVDALHMDIDAARARRLLGDLPEARVRAEAADRAATALGYVPLQAEARAELAKVEDEIGDPQRAATLYDEAIHLAQVSHHDPLAAALLTERVELSAHELRGDPSAALRLDMARTAQERVGADDRSRARLAAVAGDLARLDGDRETAARHYGDAIAIADATEGGAMELPFYVSALAAVTDSRDDRLRLRRRALELGRERFGPQHPRIVMLAYNLGAELQAAGLDGAEPLALAESIWSEHLESPLMRAQLDLSLADGALARGELDVAERHADDAARILAEALPADDPKRGPPEHILAQVLAMRADQTAEVEARDALRTRAIEHARRALEHTADPSQLLALHQLLGNQLMSLGRFAEAERAFQRAGDQGGDALGQAIISLRRAELALRRGELDDAARHLDAVGPQARSLGSEGPAYALLRALVALRLQHPGEAELAALRQARADHPLLDPGLRAWLDELGSDATERQRLGFDQE
ncbi:MAG: protein kinase, partial [Myxococcales bacterium]|nr:protein kinase [Myxococcales bacterium]